MRNSIIIRTLFFITLFASFALLGCSDEKNPLSAFEPEIINETDAFQFQITDASNVTTGVSYKWNNTGSAATIDHSSALTDGAATVTVFDADSVQVYTSNLKASGVETTSTGSTGTWTIFVAFSGFDGTANFRLEKVT